MASLHGKRVLIGKTYYFAYSSNSFLTPERVTNYWQVMHAIPGESSIDGAEAYIEQRHYGSVVVYRLGQRLWSADVAVRSECDRTESEPLPCPKVRKGIETRYRNGRWEKRLKTGWVPA